MGNKLELQNVCDIATSVVLWNEGRKVEIKKGDELFEKAIQEYKIMVKGSHSMPAFGVAIHDLTISHLGTAYELLFDGLQHIEDFEFERIFIRVEKNYSGINLERFIGEKYCGRCFYLNLSKECEGMYNFIVNNS